MDRVIFMLSHINKNGVIFFEENFSEKPASYLSLY